MTEESPHEYYTRVYNGSCAGHRIAAARKATNEEVKVSENNANLVRAVDKLKRKALAKAIRWRQERYTNFVAWDEADEKLRTRELEEIEREVAGYIHWTELNAQYLFTQYSKSDEQVTDSR